MDIMTPLNTAAYDFPVAKMPLFTKSPDGDMQMVPTEVQMAVVREDTGKVLATVGSKYEIVPHKDAFDAATEALIGSGLDTSNVKVTDGVYEHGARARRTIILPENNIQPAVGDRMHLKIDLFNSLDGRWAFRTEFGYFRLICLNGMVRPDFSAGIYAKHTGKINVEDIANRMMASLKMMVEDEETFAAWTQIKVTEAAAGWFFAKTMARVARRGMEDDVNKTLHQRLMRRFAQEPDSVWGLYNAMTAWSSHEPIPRGAPHNVKLAREGAVAAALRSQRFAEIVDGAVDAELA